MKGYWVIIDDLDTAPIEFIASISALLEHRTLFLPHMNMEVKAHPNFRIIGTRALLTSSYNEKNNSTVDYSSLCLVSNLRHFSHLWHFVSLADLTQQEITAAIYDLHPKIPDTIIEKIIKVYDIFSSLSSNATVSVLKKKYNDLDEELVDTLNSLRYGRISSLRKFSLREVFRVVTRINSYCHEFNEISGFITEQQLRKTFSEVVDVFVCAIRSKDTYVEVVQIIGTIWGLSSILIDTYYIQEVVDDNNAVIISRSTVKGKAAVNNQSSEFVRFGRAVLSCLPFGQSDSTVRQTFAMTKYATRIMERVATCVLMREPVLLVGETGTGKTTTVQQIATMTNRQLLVHNISLSTDVSDLFGGFRPVTLKQLFRPLYENFVRIFQETLSSSSNQKFLQVVSEFYQAEKWTKLLKAFSKACDNAITKLSGALKESSGTESLSLKLVKWKDFKEKIVRQEVNLPKISAGFAFSFMDGTLIEAMRKGHWILLDEINLASPETLQNIAGLLDTQTVFLSEGSDLKYLKCHPEFRIFAAMNPPTDVGKRELSASLRSRFTEIYTEEMTDENDLRQVVEGYFDGIAASPVDDAVSVYLGCRASSEMSLTDISGQRPHYSLRSLTRSLRAAKSFMNLGIKPLSRSLLEGFLVNFQTLLSPASRKYMKTFLKQSLAPGLTEKEINFPPTRPGGKSSSAADWVLIKPFWLHRGPFEVIDWSEKKEDGTVRFVMTPTVEANIRDIAAAIAANVAPILLQGATSVGKTTMIEYLAAKCGYKCVRINNHEHTDVQEYIGGYATNVNGQLEFKDGLLVSALRKGQWIILDELNLAPSDVLEALNRLLDDNKELLIPETGEIVRPSNGFQLFATQNPPGIYGGRKPLSRAFRNRFLEISVCDLPTEEIQTIVTNSCGIAPKFSQMLVKTMQEIQVRRQNSTLFEGKYGLITTRDLIKWGNRRPQNSIEVAREGYVLLAEKLRNLDEKSAIEELLNTVCKVKIVKESLYSIGELSGMNFALNSLVNLPLSKDNESVGANNNSIFSISNLCLVKAAMDRGEMLVEGVPSIALTASIRRMWSLVGRCIQYNEPALLIGETGTGKTTVGQLFASYLGQRIHILNCHQSTEAADIIGGLRPVRGRGKSLSIITSNLIELYNLLFDGTAPTNTETIPNLLHIVKDCSDGDENLQWPDIVLKSAISETDDLIKQKCDVVDGEAPIKRMRIEDSDGSNTTYFNSDLGSQGTRLLLETREAYANYCALFEWHDGPLIAAMVNGDVFLLDEINLAEDAVIERLNSVLESGRTITLAEKGGTIDDVIVAHPNFKFIATMNPGGDFGKRELSPALRSRFTEIWIPSYDRTTDREDMLLILSEILSGGNALDATFVQGLAGAMMDFMDYINNKLELVASSKMVISIREIIAWARFVHQWQAVNLSDYYLALVHGAHIVILDGLGLGHAIPRDVVKNICLESFEYLLDLSPKDCRDFIERDPLFTISYGSISSTTSCVDSSNLDYYTDDGKFCVGKFSISLGPYAIETNKHYVLNAKSTTLNLGRVLRGMQLTRPILLEGPPGVGKSSLIANLAMLTGNKLVRINLSEHSELSDLLGTDLPAPSTGDGMDNSPKFVWNDGVFLAAMKRGDWVLLDELNLAPQSVLEGLNACFDHRQEVFITELGITVQCPKSFRVFCAQNPMAEGGGRKGLPQSFLSRFSRVYVESMTTEDILAILSSVFSGGKEFPADDLGDEMKVVISDSSTISQLSSGKLIEFLPLMVDFVQLLQVEITDKGTFGRVGSPWEFNLRDIFRWCEALVQLSFERKCEDDGHYQYLLSDTAYTLFVSKMRSYDDRKSVCKSFESVFKFPLLIDNSTAVTYMSPSTDYINGSATCITIGKISIPLKTNPGYASTAGSMNGTYSTVANSKDTTNFRGKYLEILAQCVSLQWPILVVGPYGSGASEIVKSLCKITGNKVITFAASPSTDATELLGSFEQTSATRHLFACLEKIERVVMTLVSMNLTNNEELSPDILGQYINLFQLSTRLSESNSLNLREGQHLISKLFSTIELLESVIADSADIEILSRWLLLAKASLSAANSICSTNNCGFEWVDGIIVTAVEQGLWLIIDNVNLCPASVLDRLNSLLEPNGTLLLTESGEGRIIKPHENFRIFFVMDPSLGEISRAMRNRCVEVSINSDDNCSWLLAQQQQYYLEADGDMNKFSNNCLTNHKKELLSKVVGDESISQSFPKFRLFESILELFDINNNRIGMSVIGSYQYAVDSILPLYSKKLAVDQYMKNEVTPTAAQFVSSIHWYFNNGLLDTEIFSILKLIALVNYDRDINIGQLSSIIATLQIEEHNFHHVYLEKVFSSCTSIKQDNSHDRFRNSNCDESKGLLDDISTFDAIPVDRKRYYLNGLLLKLGFLSVYKSQWLVELIDNLLQRICLSKQYQMIQRIFSDHEHLLFNSVTESNSNTQKDEQLTYLLGQKQLENSQSSRALQISIKNAQSESQDTNILQSVASGSNWELMLLLLQRFPIIIEEEECKELTLNNKNIMKPSTKSNNKEVPLYSIAMALKHQLIRSDSRDLFAIGSVFTLVTISDQLVKELLALFKHAADTIHVHVDEVLRCTKEVLVCRDYITLTLVENNSSLSNFQLVIPWEKLSIAIKWWKKMYNKTHTIIGELLLELHSGAEKHRFEVLKMALDGQVKEFDHAMGVYWSQNYYLSKKRLWKEGGHSVVPSTTTGWELWGALTKLPQSLLQKIKVSKFTDTVKLFVDNSQRFLQTAQGFELMQEWLCLCSTFYWAYSEESVASNRIRMSTNSVSYSNAIALAKRVARFDIQSLIHAIGLKLADYEKQINSVHSNLIEEGIEEFYNTDADSNFDLLSKPSITRIIHDELAVIGANNIGVLADLIVIKALSRIIYTMSYLRVSTQGVESTDVDFLHATYGETLQALLVDVQSVISVSLRYCLFNPIVLRELQTFAWSIDATINQASTTTVTTNSDSNPQSNWTVVLQLLANFSTVLESRMYMVCSSSVVNSLDTLELSFKSKTLSSICSRKTTLTELLGQLINNDADICCEVPWVETLRSGQVADLFPIVTELVARHLDLTVLFPSSSNKIIHKILSNQSSVDTEVHLLNGSSSTLSASLSTCARAKKTLLQMFRLIVEASKSNASTTKSTDQGLLGSATRSNRLARLPQLLLSTLHIVYSCRDYYQPDTLTTVMSIKDLRASTIVEYVTIATTIRNLNLLEKIENESLVQLYRQCLVPILDLLANDAVYKTPNNYTIDISKAWICCGLLQAHLLMPAMPIDPATRHATKAKLLSPRFNYLKAQMESNYLYNVVSNRQLVDAVIVSQVNEVKVMKDKLTKFNSLSIERPTDCPAFGSFFDDLRNGINSLCDVQRLSILIGGLTSAVEELKLQATARKEKKAKAVLNTLQVSLQEEVTWQASAGALIEKLQEEYSCYEDIYSPIVSAIANISNGLRVMSYFIYGKASNASATGRNSVSKGDKSSPGSGESDLTIDDIVSSLSSFPNGIHTSYQTETKHEFALLTINNLLIAAPSLISQVYDGISQDSTVTGMTKEDLKIVLEQVVSLNSLAVINYSVGNGAIPLKKVYNYVASVVKKFVDSHLAAEAEDMRRKEMEKAMYRHRIKEDVYDSAEQADDEELVRRHFPNSVNTLELDEKFVPLAEETETNSNSILDSDITLSLVSFHSSTVLKYYKTQLIQENFMLRTISSVDKESAAFLKERVERIELQRNYLLRSMKIFTKPICQLFSPNTDVILRGNQLLGLSAMAKLYSTNIDSSTITRRKNTNKIIDGVDRDLEFILDGNSIYNKTPNFYSDANPSEVLKATAILQRIVQRATELLITFPSNELLIQVCRVTILILDYNLATSLGKMLISIELLLKKAEEWEKYAAKHVSLREEMNLLGILIKQWRKVELDSWEQLLRVKEIEYAQRALATWYLLARVLNNIPILTVDENEEYFNNCGQADVSKCHISWNYLHENSPSWLYESEIAASANRLKEIFGKANPADANDSGSANESNVNSYQNTSDLNHTMSETIYLSKIFSILEGLLKSSNVGEFPTRLHLVRVFAAQLLFESQSSNGTNNHTATKRKLANLVYGVWRYYEQFLPAVRKFQDTLSNPIQTRIKNEIKIGKWDDLNTYALLEHSEKIHRKLSRIIQEYNNDVLDYPISAILRKDINQSLIDDKGELVCVSTVPTITTMFPVMERISDQVVDVINTEIEFQRIATSSKSEASVTTVGAVPIEAMTIVSQKFPKMSKIESLVQKMEKYLQDCFETTTVATIVHNPVAAEEIDPASSSDEIKDAAGDHENVDADSADVNAQEIANVHSLHAAYFCEDLCDTIFERINMLRSESVTKSLKQRAVGDLLSMLKENGISYLKTNTAAEVREHLLLLSSLALLPCEYVSNLCYNSKSVHCALDKGELYYQRSIVELSQLRTQTATVIAVEISNREAMLMTNFSENLFFKLIRVRSTLSTAIFEYKDISNSVQKLNDLWTHCSSISSGNESIYDICKDYQRVSDAIAYNKHTVGIVHDNLVQMEFLLSTAEQAHSPENLEDNCQLPTVDNNTMRKTLTILRSCMERLGDILVGPSATLPNNNELLTCNLVVASSATEMSAILAEQKQIMSIAFKEFDSIHTILIDVLSAELVTPIHSAFQHLYLTAVQEQIESTSLQHEVASDSLSEEVMELSSALIDQCLIAVQKIQSVYGAKGDEFVGCFGDIISVQQNDSEEDVKTLTENITLAIATMGALRMDAIRQSLAKLLHKYEANANQINLQLIRSVMPLLNTITSTQNYLISAMANMYKSVGKLLYVCLRVFRTLLCNGYCPVNTKEEDGDGDGNMDIDQMIFEDQEGTGMGEGEGKKDVSDQIENEDQLLGLKNEQPQEPQTEKKSLDKEEKDTGVEMSENFEGENYDVPSDEEDNQADDEDDDKEELEREMGDADLEDIVDEKQWNDEEDNEEDKTNKGEEKFEKDSKMAGDTLDEMVTKEDDGEVSFSLSIVCLMTQSSSIFTGKGRRETER